MKVFRKGKLLKGYRIASVLNMMPGRIEYLVIPVDREDQKEYRAVVYDMDELPVPYIWASEERSSQSLIPLECHFFDSQPLHTFPICVEKGESYGMSWIIFKLNDGLTITDFVKSNGPLPSEKAIKAIIGLCRSVETITGFENGLGHYNITPDTVRIRVEPDEPIMTLDGFGYMTRHGESVCFDRPIGELSYYLAPEIFVDRLSAKADVYGICLLLYMLLTGKSYPWDRESLPLYSNVIAGNCRKEDFLVGMGRLWNAAPDLTDIKSETLKTIMYKGLSTNPNKRTPDVMILRELLEQHLFSAGENCDETEDRQTQGKGFSVVAGLSELKEQMRRKFILPIRQQKLAQSYGIYPPNGCLLFGPPGCGKTFVVERIAEEAGIPCIIYKPSDIASIYIHGGQERIKELFSDVRSHAPVMVCFDEADAFVSCRTRPGNEQYAGEVNEFLTQLNNAAKDGVYVFLLTNNPELIDPAVLRTGRVDEKFYIPMPDKEGREEFFKIRLKGLPLSGMVDFSTLADQTQGMTFSDLDYIITESCRTMFFRVIESKKNEILPITQQVVESVIGSTQKSVSFEEVRRFEKVRDEFRFRGSGKERAKIGFF